MAKKRKTPSGRSEASSGPNLDIGASKKRIRDYQDVADSDDEFHINRDRVLLDEGPDAKRRRKWQEQEEFLEPSDEEVLHYSGAEEEDEASVGSDEVVDDRDAPDSTSEGSAEDGAEDDEEGVEWGMSKGEIYGADEIETEEQALAEEAEALRLQKKQLQSMTAADYGFDESEWQDKDASKSVDQTDRNVVTEVLPQLQVRDDWGPNEKLNALRKRYPEFEPLSNELLSLQEVTQNLAKETDSASSQHISKDFPNATTKLTAASAYIAVLTMYFVLLSSPASGGSTDTVALSATQLRDHPVMDSLVKCRELWMQVKDLPPDPQPTKREMLDLATANGVSVIPSGSAVDRDARKQSKKSQAQKHADAAQSAADDKRAERLQRTTADLANLDALIAPSAARKSVLSRGSRSTENGADSDMGEEASLNTHEAAEKAKRRKSLRFYTSQIAQKANKRGTAGRNAGGDDDIPYRERLKDRQARLNAQAEKRGRHAPDAHADLGGESDEDDARAAQAIRAGGEDADYYDQIAARTAKKKADKAAFAEAQRHAALQGGQVVEEEAVGPDGKRKITYAIEKNKGLTPHRKKDVRNPRVKKRKKYDEKKKKLGSIKPVYKGGEGRGGYGGELTGIKKGLVKSTKL
ncbi:something about silencing protein 10 [Vermiconidia calcicola]|uniref:Something about silencing protein 10 n=1 Tax=Vermiconidia calcicola TaxID=1690605 RepID=A0ACC3NP65_9PEZI|nr:something about silencing protein 10 [Vermiconidia calcicola]